MQRPLPFQKDNPPGLYTKWPEVESVIGRLESEKNLILSNTELQTKYERIALGKIERMKVVEKEVFLVSPMPNTFTTGNFLVTDRIRPTIWAGVSYTQNATFGYKPDWSYTQNRDFGYKLVWTYIQEWSSGYKFAFHNPERAKNPDRKDIQAESSPPILPFFP